MNKINKSIKFNSLSGKGSIMSISSSSSSSRLGNKIKSRT